MLVKWPLSRKVSVVTILVLTVGIIAAPSYHNSANGISTGRIHELIHDQTREFYLVGLRDEPNQETKQIVVEIICKNMTTNPLNCINTPNLRMKDTDGYEYYISNTVSNLRVDGQDIIRASLEFTLPKQSAPTSLTMADSGSSYLVDLTKTKEPPDPAPVSDWVISAKEAKVIQIPDLWVAIYGITRYKSTFSDDEFTQLDVGIINKGDSAITFNPSNLYLKDDVGVVLTTNYYGKAPRLASANIDRNSQIRGWMSLDSPITGKDAYMLIYDDVANGVYFHDGVVTSKEGPIIVPPLPIVKKYGNENLLARSVEFTAPAFDRQDGELKTHCTPESGEIFPKGISEVACVATDSDGNRSTASFFVILQ